MNLAIKEILYNKSKYIIMMIVLVATMYLVFFTLGLTTGLRYFGASKFINSDVETFVLGKDSNGSLINSSFSHAYGEEMKETLDDPGAFVLGVTMSNVKNTANQKDSQLFEIAYFGLESYTAMSPTLVEGRMPQEEGEVLATKNIANEGVSLGDHLYDDRINTSFQIVGFTDSQTYNYSPILYLYPSQFVQTSFLGQVTGYADVSSVITHLPKEDLGHLTDHFDVELYSREEIILNTPGLLAQSVSFFLLMASMYVISATIIAMFFYIVTIQQKRDYGLLKAFGKTNSELGFVIVSKVFVITFASLVLSVALIYLTEFLLPSIVPFMLDPWRVLRAGLLFLVVGVISSVVSLRAMVKVPPMITIGGGFQ